MRGHALECSLFSAMAIGGLALGVPAAAVYRHLSAARRNLAKCRDLREPPVVSALVLYGVANALVPPCNGDGGGGGGGQQQHAHKQEYQTSLDDAQALYEALPVKNPLMLAFLTYRAMCDNLVSFLVKSAYSVNPANAYWRRDAAVGVAANGAGDGGGIGGGGGDQRTSAGAVGSAGTRQRAHAPPTKTAHSSYVVADSECSRGDWKGRREK